MSTGPRPFLGLAAGIAAGLVAAAAMSAFQERLATLPAGDGDGDDEPAATASPYVVGAVMGGIFGVLSEYRPEASAGFGGAYGLAAAALADPVTALDLAPEDAVEPQIGGVAAHLIFGAVLEGVRWLIAGRRS